MSGSRTWRKLRLPVSILVCIAALFGLWVPARAASRTGVSYPVPTIRTAKSPTDLPVPAPEAISAGSFHYFPQTGHFLRGIFLEYWQSHGAIPVLGLPITEPLMEDGMAVQYLERARLEWHPEISADPNHQVLLSRLGAILTSARNIRFQRRSPASNSPGSVYFPETGHNLGGAFLTYWKSKGGLPVFGFPISEQLTETNAADGKQYIVQYFERNRFEWHPERGPANKVQLGLLGAEYARSTMLNPLARVLLPGPVPAAQTGTGIEKLSNLVDPDLLPAVDALGRTSQFQWVPVVLASNNIPVQFADLGEQGMAGAFAITHSARKPYVIVVSNSARGAPVPVLAGIIAHEATHAYNFESAVVPARLSCSVEEETRAFMNGLAAWLIFMGPDALAQTYDPGSIEAQMNGALVSFNGGNTRLGLDFNLQTARKFVRRQYGPDCGN